MGAKRIAVLGAGGIGKSVVKMLENKKELLLVAICDSGGYAFSLKGIPSGLIDRLLPEESVANLSKIGLPSADPIESIMDKIEKIDGIVIALPNIPGTFIPGVVRRIVRSGFKGAIVDFMKRSQSIEQIIKLKSVIKKAGITYVTGAGASPGILSSAAAIAAQSFNEIEKIEIKLGIGLKDWTNYRSTIREFLVHFDGYTTDKVAKLSDEDIDDILSSRQNILQMQNIKHGDEVILESAGIVDRRKTNIECIINTNAANKKPFSQVIVTGTTFEGKTCKNVFSFSEDISIADNACGSALGFMKSAFWLQDYGINGVFTSADIIPRFIR